MKTTCIKKQSLKHFNPVIFCIIYFISCTNSLGHLIIPFQKISWINTSDNIVARHADATDQRYPKSDFWPFSPGSDDFHDIGAEARIQLSLCRSSMGLSFICNLSCLIMINHLQLLGHFWVPVQLTVAAIGRGPEGDKCARGESGSVLISP